MVHVDTQVMRTDDMGNVPRQSFQQKELRKFIPHINNWAICDCSCATYKFMRVIFRRMDAVY